MLLLALLYIQFIPLILSALLTSLKNIVRLEQQCAAEEKKKDRSLVFSVHYFTRLNGIIYPMTIKRPTTALMATHQ